MIKIFLLLCFFAFFAQQQTVLLSSSPSNTIAASHTGESLLTQTFINSDLQNLGNGAQWLWPGNSLKKIVVYQAKFYAPCDGPTTLTISARNNFSAIVNGVTKDKDGAVMGGNEKGKKYSFILAPLKCGLNNLTITVSGAPATVSFSIIQNQSSCFNCTGSSSFYNRSSCQCECIQGCNCG